MIKRVPIFAIIVSLLMLVGCAQPPTKAPVTQQAAAPQPVFVPYIPSAEPPPPEVKQELPDSPQDAPKDLKLVYSVEIWELLLPRNTVSSDEVFWKRINESLIDLSIYTIMLKNGVRVGSLPIRELSVIEDLIEDRKGKRTRLAGIAGKYIEIPIATDLSGQTIFYFNRSNQLIGRTYDRCENLFYFSFEPTPRKQNNIRLVLTPSVRGLSKKLQFSLIPGKLEKEIAYKSEEVRYDASLNLDLDLSNVLIVSPSVEARDSTSIGGTFLIKNTPTEQLERLIIIIPRAYKRGDAESASSSR